ncbi:MAG: PA14 domain-containing protein, partial [Planctomycetota bacterium]
MSSTNRCTFPGCFQVLMILLLGLLLVLPAHAAVFKNAQPTEVEALKQGVTLRVYRVEQPPILMPELVPGQTPNADVRIDSLEVRGADGFAGIDSPVVAHLTAKLRVDIAGSHRFRLTSDDGSFLDINGLQVIENDGRHAMVPVESGTIDLGAGLHDLRVRYFDSWGERGLLLEWQPPGANDFSRIPPDLLATEAGVTRVISPGIKRVLEGRRPGDGVPLEDVHPSFRIDNLRPEGFKPMVGSMCFDASGRLIVGTFFPIQMGGATLPDMESKEPDTLIAITGIRPSENPDGNPSLVETRVVAEGLFEPAGLCAVGEAIYVAQRRAITKLTDTDGDGFFETHENVGEGWDAWNYHEFTFGLEHIDRDGDGPHPGYLYGALSTSIAPLEWDGVTSYAGPNGPWRGGVIEVDLSTNTTHVIAGGTRTPNGLGLGPVVDGEPTLFYADNQGSWMPTSQFSEVIPGRFYGHDNPTGFVPNLAERFPDGGLPSVFVQRPRTPAAILLPHNELSRSPTQSLLIEHGPYEGQMLLGELTAGGLRRLFLERVNGTWQGAVFRHSQGLEAGVNRLIRGPEGALYIGGIGGNGNWNWNDTRFGLQRLSPSDADVAFEMHSVSATTDGFIIRFTHDVATDWLADPSNYRLSQWSYEPTEDYGGPKMNMEPLEVELATVVNSRAVRIAVPGVQVGRCIAIHCDPLSLETGERIRSPEAWYTLNTRPIAHEATDEPSFARAAERSGLGVGVLPPADATPLITGNAAAQWQRVGRGGPSTEARTHADVVSAPGYIETTGGDRETAALFGDARFHIEWYSPPGGQGQSAGNSGVYVQGLYELQVLGTLTAQRLGRELRADEAGAIYGVRAASANSSNGPGEWQAYDIWF